LALSAVLWVAYQWWPTAVDVVIYGSLVALWTWFLATDKPGTRRFAFTVATVAVLFAGAVLGLAAVVGT